MTVDVKELIASLNAQDMNEAAEAVAQLTGELEQVTRERDAAINDVRALCYRYRTCYKCSHCGEPDRSVCIDCLGNGRRNWDWNGPEKRDRYVEDYLTRLVFCEDCKHRIWFSGRYVCGRSGIPDLKFPVQPDDCCSYGERRRQFHYRTQETKNDAK